MKIDIFEDMKECVGCDNISDLPYGSELEMDDRYLFTTSGVFRYQ